LNPITTAKMHETLRTILNTEGKRIRSEVLMQLIEASNGDLRSAIIALQMYATRAAFTSFEPIAKLKRKSSKSAVADNDNSNNGYVCKAE